MKKTMTVADILNSVEFELMQHTLLQDDVADGIQRLRAYQTNARNKMFGAGKNPSISAAIDFQFDANAMLLTLLQVINQNLVALQQDFRRAAFAQLHTPPPADAASAESAQFDDDQSNQQWRTVAATSPSTPAALGVMDFDHAELSPDALDAYITDEPPLLEMDVRESQTPLLGGVINRARRELHELVLFYVNKLVRQQADVNLAYGTMLRELIAANQAQAEEIRELRRLLLQLAAQQPTTATPNSSGDRSPAP